MPYLGFHLSRLCLSPGAVGDGVVRQLLHLLSHVLVLAHLRYAARSQGDRRVADGPAAGLLVRHRRARADRGRR